jgi:hypothetical protein
MPVRFQVTPAGWFWYVADEQAGPFATYDEAVERQRQYQPGSTPCSRHAEPNSPELIGLNAPVASIGCASHGG